MSHDFTDFLDIAKYKKESIWAQIMNLEEIHK